MARRSRTKPKARTRTIRTQRGRKFRVSSPPPSGFKFDPWRAQREITIRLKIPKPQLPRAFTYRHKVLRRTRALRRFGKNLDRRRFRSDAAFLLDGRRDYVKLAKKTVKGLPYRALTNSLQFANPLRNIVCIRRKERRRVLFTQKKIGKGKGGSNKPRILNKFSRIRC